KLPYELAARVFAIVFDALQALHQSGVRAGDLTAECLVFTSADHSGTGARTVRVLGAGFPRQLFDAAALGVAGKEQLPESGRNGGSAPGNLALGGEVRPEEEIFRLGTVLYRCVTGQEAHPAGTASGRAPVPVRQAAPEVPAMLADLIDRLVDPVAANRPKSAAAVAKSLRVFLKTEEEERQARAEDKLVVAVPAPTADGSAAQTAEER